MKKEKFIQITINQSGQIIGLTDKGRVFAQEMFYQKITDKEGALLNYNPYFTGKWLEIKYEYER